MIAFWILAPIMVLAALGILFVRKAVHAALLLAVVMISLAVLYAVLDAPFLFAVQIIVYTGAILMLFLFVLMLVGVDASDSRRRDDPGPAGAGDRRRPAARRCCWSSASRQVALGTVVGLDEANAGGNIQALADSSSPATSSPSRPPRALLITAALGAMVLAHRERLTPEADPGRPGRAADARLRRAGKHPGPLPSPGVFARHNAVDTPALLPDGTAAGVVGLPGARGPRHGPRRRRRWPTTIEERPAPSGARRDRAADGDRPTTTHDREDQHERHAVHRPLRDPVHDRLRRRADPAQRDRGVHVRRADAQRQQPRPGHLRPSSTATSTARSPPSS